ncbi:hypothetical protein ISCGN_014122 [Ixodes scapularis]
MATADIAASQLTNIFASILSQDISQSVLLAQLRCLLTVCRRSCKPHSSLLIHVPTCRSTSGKITVLRTHHEAIVNWLLRITNIT